MINNQENMNPNSRMYAMDNFLSDPPLPKPPSDPIEENMDCSSGVCVIKNDKSILERINKKIITEDGRQLLI
jgi:hypothetical protein